MPVQITIEDVPEDVHNAFAVRAARQHQHNQYIVVNLVDHVIIPHSYSIFIAPAATFHFDNTRWTWIIS